MLLSQVRSPHSAIIVARCSFECYVANGVSVLAQIVDYCEQCAPYSIGVPKALFQVFSNISSGIVHNVKWAIE